MIATIVSRKDDAQMIADAMARFTGEIVQLEGFTEPKPIPRSNWIDPEAKLKRKKPLSAARLQQLNELHERRRMLPAERGKTIKELAAEHGVPYSTLRRRLTEGLTLEQAVSGTQERRQCRLTQGQVRMIRRNPDELTVAGLAERYCVHIKTIESIRSFRTWKGVV